jgi:hypothetical protein
MAEELEVVCAWCTAPVSTVASSGRVSHGICVDCAVAFLKKLPKDYLATIAEPDGTVSLFSGHRLDVATGEAR